MFAAYAPLRNFVARRNFTPEDFHRRWIGPVTRRVKTADDVRDERFLPRQGIGPRLLPTPRARKGRRTVLFCFLLRFARALPPAAARCPGFAPNAALARTPVGHGSQRVLLAAN